LIRSIIPSTSFYHAERNAEVETEVHVDDMLEDANTSESIGIDRRAEVDERGWLGKQGGKRGVVGKQGGHKRGWVGKQGGKRGIVGKQGGHKRGWVGKQGGKRGIVGKQGGHKRDPVEKSGSD
jgi:hypothetical protein